MHNVPYSRYMQIRDTLFERLTEEYTNEIGKHINRNNIPNTPRPSSVFWHHVTLDTMRIALDQPPPFAAETPLIGMYPGMLEDMKADQRAEATRKPYKEVPPTVEEPPFVPTTVKSNHHVPMVNAVVPSDDRSQTSKSCAGSKQRKWSNYSQQSYRSSKTQKYAEYNPALSFDPIEVWPISGNKSVASGNRSVSSENRSIAPKHHGLERNNRNYPHRIRPKFDRITWNGMCTTFNTFKAAVDSHLMQVDALYLTDTVFVHHYREHGPQCLVSDVIIQRFKQSILSSI